MSKVRKVPMFLSPRFVIQSFLNYVLQPTVYSYCHNAMALQDSLKQTFKRKHVDIKMNQKGKENFKIKEGDWSLLFFAESGQEDSNLKCVEEALTAP